MAPISFARGAPAPECLDPALIADCARGRARARRDDDPRPTARAAATGRCASCSRERHGVEPGRVFLTTGGLQGFVFYAAVQLARRPGRVLVEAPTYDRPLKLLALATASRSSRSPMDDEGLDLDALEAELARGRATISFLYTIPTFQNPSGRTLGDERRRRIVELAAEHDLRRPRGRPVRPRPLRGRAAAVAPRARGRRARHVHVVVLEDGRARAARRLVRRPRGAARRLRRARRLDLHLAVAAAAGDVHELFARGAFEPNLERCAGCSARARTRCSPRSTREMPDGATLELARGRLLPLGRLRPGASTPADLLARATEAGVTFVRGTDFFPPATAARSSARLAFSYESPERIAEGVALLARSSRLLLEPDASSWRLTASAPRASRRRRTARSRRRAPCSAGSAHEQRRLGREEDEV